MSNKRLKAGKVELAVIVDQEFADVIDEIVKREAYASRAEYVRTALRRCVDRDRIDVGEAGSCGLCGDALTYGYQGIVISQATGLPHCSGNYAKALHVNQAS